MAWDLEMPDGTAFSFNSREDAEKFLEDATVGHFPAGKACQVASCDCHLYPEGTVEAPKLPTPQKEPQEGA